jgi:hypothetical protein
MQSDQIKQLVNHLLQSAPQEQARILAPYLYAFFSFIPFINKLERNIAQIGWIFSVQNIAIALPQKNEYLGLRILVQLKNNFTGNEPQLVAEIPLIYDPVLQDPLNKVTGGLVAMRNLDVPVCSDRLLGDLVNYLKSFRDMIVGSVKKIMKDSTSATPTQTPPIPNMGSNPQQTNNQYNMFPPQQVQQQIPNQNTMPVRNQPQPQPESQVQRPPSTMNQKMTNQELYDRYNIKINIPKTMDED